MEISKDEHKSIRAEVRTKSKFEEPKFEFEDMIIEHQRKFPRTAAFVESPNYIQAMLKPLRYFYILPIALMKLKLNTIISQNWKAYLKLWIYIFLLCIPNTVLVLGIFAKEAFFNDLIFTVVLPFLIAVLLSLFYLKFTHDGFLGLISAKQIEWLEAPVKEYYDKIYDKRAPKNILLIICSIVSGIGLAIPMIILAWSKGIVLSIVFGIISIIFNPILFYIFFLTSIFMIQNTKIYSQVLETIKNRVSRYIDEYGTLLTRENYEIIWALGDTPGRSIRQLENIPIAGILSALIITLAMIMGSLNQLIYGFYGEMLRWANPPLYDGTLKYSDVVGIIALLIATIMVIVVVFPLYTFSTKMKKFKQKSLIELDNYIYANVIEFEERYADYAKQEAVTMFSLREFIAAMKTIPISTTKILKSVVAVLMWFLNVRRIFLAFAG